MDADGRIRTQFDDLVASLKLAGGRPQSVSELSSAARLPAGGVVKWLYILEKHGQVRLENRLSGIYASWTGEPEKARPPADEAVAVSHPFESDIDIARERESEAQRTMDDDSQKKKSGQEERMRHRVALDAADAELASVGEKISRINSLLTDLKQKRSEAKQSAAAEAVRPEAEAKPKRGEAQYFAATEAARPETEAAKSAGEEAQRLADEARRAAEEKEKRGEKYKEIGWVQTKR